VVFLRRTDEEHEFQGTKGELLFGKATNTITVTCLGHSELECIRLPRTDSYHPQDRDIVANWLAVIRGTLSDGVGVNASESLKTHAIVFASEQTRLENRVVHLPEMLKNMAVH